MTSTVRPASDWQKYRRLSSGVGTNGLVLSLICAALKCGNSARYSSSVGSIAGRPCAVLSYRWTLSDVDMCVYIGAIRI